MGKQKEDQNCDKGDFTVLDDLIRFIAVAPKPKTQMVDPKMLLALVNVGAKLERLLREVEANTRVELQFDPMFATATLTAELDELTIYSIPDFCAVVAAAANFEVYPLTNGKIRLSILFRRAVRPLEN